MRLLAATTSLVVALGLLGLVSGRPGQAQEARFTTQYLNDPRAIEQGRQVWVKRCTFCHGKTAYPGKGPKLDPSRYTPQFVYDRVVKGFRGMPSWTHEFTDEELRAVVAYILSGDFSN